MNHLIDNFHSVPLTNLITLNVFVIIGLTLLVKYYGYDWKTAITLFVILLIIDIFIHPCLNIPNNISYYFGLGPKPKGWMY
jgi:hypothetical protein